MELDFEPITLALTGGFYIVCVFLIWYFNAGMMTWDMPVRTKIILTIAMLPITYVVIIWQKNR